MSTSILRSSVLERLSEPGSPAHAALLRVFALHLLLVLQSPSLPLLIAIEPRLHPQAHVLGGETLFALLSPSIVAAARVVGSVAALCVLLGVLGRIATAVLLGAFLVTQCYWFGATVFHDDWIFFTFPLLAFSVLAASLLPARGFARWDREGSGREASVRPAWGGGER